MPNFDKWYVHASTLGPIGRIPFAPGTWGSIPGLLSGALIYQLADGQAFSLHFRLTALVLCIIFSYLVIYQTEEYWQLHDRSEIVVDEFAGQLIPTLFFPPSWELLLISFVLFRLFDILKPGPIGYIDREGPGAIGTLFDDIVAGVFTLIVVGLLYNFVL